MDRAAAAVAEAAEERGGGHGGGLAGVGVGASLEQLAHLAPARDHDVLVQEGHLGDGGGEVHHEEDDDQGRHAADDHRQKVRVAKQPLEPGQLDEPPQGTGHGGYFWTIHKRRLKFIFGTYEVGWLPQKAHLSLFWGVKNTRFWLKSGAKYLLL